jgi:hypothetical protein
MKSTKTKRTSWKKRALRVAAGVAVTAVAATGIGIATGGAGASTGWGQMTKTINK